MFAAFGLGLPVSGVVFTAGNAVIGVVTGVAVTVAAALAGALRASRTSPLAAMRDAASDTSAASRTRIVGGGVLTSAGVAVCAAGALGHQTPLASLGAIVTIAGVIMAGPATAALTARVPGALLARLRGMPGKLARRNMARTPKRAAATAAALIVGMAVVTVFTVFGASLKASAGANLSQTFTGDLVVSAAAPGVMRGAGGAGFSPDLAQRIAAIPGVAVAAGTQPGTILLDGASTPVTVADPALLGQVFRLGAVPPGELAVSATTAAAHGWHTGSAVQVTFPDGHRSAMPIGRVYQPIGPLGNVVVPAATWAAHSTQPRNTAVYVALRPGADAAAATRQISAIATTAGAASVQDRTAYLAAAGSGVTPLLGIIYVMLALAIVIALLGIGSTLALAVHERTREIGLLRAVGATGAQIRTMVRWEAVLTATLGTGTGAVLGLFLGWALVTSVKVTSAGAPGATGVVSVPWPQVAAILLIGVAAGLLAGARPARRAARLDPLTAIAVN